MINIADFTYDKNGVGPDHIHSATKEEMRELLRKEPFAARTQAYCYAWANS